MLTQCGVGVHENHALTLKLFVDLVVDDFRLVLSGNTRDQTLALSFGNPQTLIGGLDVVGQVVPGLCLLLAGSHEVLNIVKVNAREVSAPGGHGLASKEPEGLEPRGQHPFGFRFEGTDVAHHCLGKPTSSTRSGRISVVPAKLINSKRVELGAIDQNVRHGFLSQCKRVIAG